MFILCDGMKWAHLPVEGGIYDQHPRLIDDFEYIAGRRAEHMAKEQAKHKPRPRMR